MAGRTANTFNASASARAGVVAGRVSPHVAAREEMPRSDCSLHARTHRHTCVTIVPPQNNSHAPQAAPTEEEAAQRAAVAALNQVAGDRALERVLPKEYVPLWTTLGQQVGLLGVCFS